MPSHMHISNVQKLGSADLSLEDALEHSSGCDVASFAASIAGRPVVVSLPVVGYDTCVPIGLPTHFCL